MDHQRGRYTAVDRAESEAASAYAINRDGAAHIAQAALEAHCQVLHISTDFVFDGQSPSPYAPDASVHPLGFTAPARPRAKKRFGRSSAMAP